jgi:hypothetical protein
VRQKHKPLLLNERQAFKAKPLLKLLVYKLTLLHGRLNCKPLRREKLPQRKCRLPKQPPQRKNVLHSSKLKKRGARLNNKEHFFSRTKNPVLTRLRVFKQVLVLVVSLHNLLRWISFKPIRVTRFVFPKVKKRLSVRLLPEVV